MIASSIIHAEQLLDLWLHDNRKNLRVGDFLHRDWVDVDGEYLVFRNPKGDKVSFSMKNSVG